MCAYETFLYIYIILAIYFSIVSFMSLRVISRCIFYTFSFVLDNMEPHASAITGLAEIQFFFGDLVGFTVDNYL